MQDFNIEKKKQIMHASYDVSLEIAQKNDISCLTIHCLIHQEALCGKEIKMCSAMKLVASITNFIRGEHKSLSHRQLKIFLHEINAIYKNLPLHCKVRWLSAGKCLQYFFAIRKEILQFLQEEISNDTTYFENALMDKDMLSELGFLTDFTQHMNNLNLKLQGKNQSISDVLHFIHTHFQIQLHLFKIEIENKELHHFPCCKEIKEEHSDVNFTGFGDLINKIASAFDSRFKELFILNNDVLLFSNPLIVAIENKNIKYRIELCNLRTDLYLLIKKETGVDFFKLLPQDLYPELRNFGLKMASMFETTYSCESAFSLMKLIKHKNRSSLTDDRLLILM
ncbi:General transcription factor II-I repeat domain-containing protein 2B [Ooceraea biroi]|uniref:General transcription factor II-I repeat domain-containing protein 2B n=1 Tax=Ooceraea biroi TaxID=2015173 RepID=A0A026VU63_OOCBI|nr:General transcription factor II-I repeat domain-containing protein 2B [Ooceraea biroi]